MALVSYCVVVRHPRRHDLCVSSRTPPRHGHGYGPVELERHFAPLVAHLTR